MRQKLPLRLENRRRRPRGESRAGGRKAERRVGRRRELKGMGMLMMVVSNRPAGRARSLLRGRWRTTVERVCSSSLGSKRRVRGRRRRRRHARRGGRAAA
eukprot:6213481-Pleurochrysis_carterae.AAC.4